MNLFVTDPCPVKAAAALDDKRVIKIILEVAQLCSTVYGERGVEGLYKPTHPHHPITHWLRNEPGALWWTLRYGLALCEVYTRFSGRHHASEPMLRKLAARNRQRVEPSYWQNSARNKKAGHDFTNVKCVHKAYRKYLLARWPNDKRVPVWTGRPQPKWRI